MTRDTDQPDWSLLPHEPEAFFELESGYSRRDLKRGYSRWIRIFKPERFPAEFQRIRAAFEQLDNALRYGTQAARSIEIVRSAFDELDFGAASGASATGDSEADVSVRGAQAQTKQRPIGRLEEIQNRIDTESPADIYRELSKQDGKSPLDYYLLALLSDTVSRPEELVFLKWLLAGIRTRPAEHGLFSLLYAYFRSDFDESAIPRILLTTAKSVRTDRFYQLTEPLWDTLLRSRPFDEFRRILKRCERELQDFRVEGRTAFYLHILKPGLWRCPEDWIAESLALVEVGLPELGGDAEFEFEVISAIRDYKSKRDQFLNGDPLRQQMDQAIQDYCQLPEPESGRTLTECQYRIASNGRDVLDAFPFGADDAHEELMTVWWWISADVLERISDRIDEPEDQQVTLKKIHKFLKSVDVQTDASLLGRVWSASGMMYALLYLGGIFILMFIVAWFPLSMWTEMSTASRIFVSAFFGTVVGLAVQQLALERMWHGLCNVFARRAYRRIWRYELQQYLRRSRLEFRQLLYCMREIPDEGLSSRNWMIVMGSTDVAMPLFVSAQRFLA